LLIAWSLGFLLIACKFVYKGAHAADAGVNSYTSQLASAGDLLLHASPGCVLCAEHTEGRLLLGPNVNRRSLAVNCLFLYPSIAVAISEALQIPTRSLTMNFDSGRMPPLEVFHNAPYSVNGASAGLSDRQAISLMLILIC
jgi:hypothetical protein